MSTLEEIIAGMLSLLLVKPVSPGDNVSMQSDQDWDSIKHIEIIMAMEERFGISFAPGDIPGLTTQKLLEDKIRELSLERSA